MLEGVGQPHNASRVLRTPHDLHADGRLQEVSSVRVPSSQNVAERKLD
jgi:hypothetical protein